MRRELFGVLLCLSCAPAPKAEPAPEDLDANVRWFWVNGEAAADPALIDAAQKLAVAGKVDTRTSPFKGQQRQRLTSEELKVVNLEANDPTKARALLVVNLFDCTLEKLASILSSAEQTTLYPEVWTSHVRTLTGDRSAFLERRAPRVAWDADVGVTFPVGDSYQSKLKGSLRRVTVPAGTSLGAELLVARLWLTEPATFSPSSTSFFRQNYEIEIFWEPQPGRIAHGYGMWREVKVGTFNVTLEDDGFFNITLDNLVDWDKKTAALCAKP
jgi:hypothetical protein